MAKPVVKIKKLENFRGMLPAYQSAEASGADICAALSSEIVLATGERALIPTGLSFEIPIGFEIQIRPRSGLAAKQGIMVVNSPGTIDSDYRGEVKVILLNTGKDPFTIRSGDRIAQMVLCPVYQAQFVEAYDGLSETSRGAGGFGSTGVSQNI